MRQRAPQESQSSTVQSKQFRYRLLLTFPLYNDFDLNKWAL